MAMSMLEHIGISAISRLLGKSDNPKRDISLAVGAVLFVNFGFEGAKYFWKRMGHSANTEDDIKKNDEKYKSEARQYQVKRQADGVFEQVRCAAKAQQHNTECTADILKIFAEKRADADRYYTNAMTDVEKARMMYELRREYKDVIREGQSGSIFQDPVNGCPNPHTWYTKTYRGMMADFAGYTGDTIVAGYVGVGLVNFFPAGAGVGKTLLMVQIAYSVALGIRPEFMPPTCPSSVKLAVVYYRLEPYDGEFQKKYGNGDFLTNAGIQWRTKMDLEDSVGFTLQGLIADLKLFASQVSEDTLVCIDPITKLPDFHADKFITGIEEVNKIASERDVKLSYLVSSHSDEIKNHKLLGTDDIRGGDTLIQQGGSVFTIRQEITGDNYRYLQSLKAPKGEVGTSNVTVCKIVVEEIDENNWNTKMVYVCDKKENEARKGGESNNKKKNEDCNTSSEPIIRGWTLSKLLELKKESEAGVSQRKLGEKYGLKAPEIGRKLKALKEYLASKGAEEEGVAE